jgi:hypothetical protein
MFAIADPVAGLERQAEPLYWRLASTADTSRPGIHVHRVKPIRV